jgi:hypothetical protein
MCTLSYIPVKQGRIITANRDESPLRTSSGLSEYQTDTENYFIAKEPIYGGTNMAVRKDGGHMAVLLNGAFEPHKRKDEYRLSRGLITLESLKAENLQRFAETIQLLEVEPFTLVHFTQKVEVLRWDGEKKHFTLFDAEKPFILASAQLYSNKARFDRQNWFTEKLQQSDLSPGQLLDFHLNGGNGDPENDMVMNRYGMVQTVSVTQLSTIPQQSRIIHLDLVRDKEFVYDLRH